MNVGTVVKELLAGNQDVDRMLEQIHLDTPDQLRNFGELVLRQLSEHFPRARRPGEARQWAALVTSAAEIIELAEEWRRAINVDGPETVQ